MSEAASEITLKDRRSAPASLTPSGENIKPWRARRNVLLFGGKRACSGVRCSAVSGHLWHGTRGSALPRWANYD